MKACTEFTMFNPSKKAILTNTLLIALLSTLSGCPSQTVGQSVNITIDKSFIEQLIGTPSKETTGNTSLTPPKEIEQDTGIASEEDEDDIIQVAYDIADSINQSDISIFTDTLHPKSEIFNIMPVLFNSMIEAGTTHEITTIRIKEQHATSAIIQVNGYLTNFGTEQLEDLYYDVLKVNDEWKLFQIRGAQGT